MKRATKPHSRLLKKLPEEVEKLQQAYPEARIELWSQDEHRIGLKPILRRIWARKGSRVRALVRPSYRWMYLYGFVEPQSGATSWLLMPTVNITAFSLALTAFAQEQEMGPNKHLLLVMDQAGWHKSTQLQVPEGLHLLFCHPIRQNFSPRSACGRSPMSRLPIGSSTPLMSWNRSKPSAVVGFKLTLSAFVGAPPFIGGLPL